MEAREKKSITVAILYDAGGNCDCKGESTVMQIKYSKHIETRIAMRKIEYDLPKRIYEDAGERFTDTETGYAIAVMSIIIYGKERDVMVAYRHEDVDINLLTIHPLKEGQKENRIKSGRWRKI
jgi:hypothetical protein